MAGRTGSLFSLLFCLGLSEGRFQFIWSHGGKSRCTLDREHSRPVNQRRISKWKVSFCMSISWMAETRCVESAPKDGFPCTRGGGLQSLNRHRESRQGGITPALFCESKVYFRQRPSPVDAIKLACTLTVSSCDARYSLIFSAVMRTGAAPTTHSKEPCGGVKGTVTRAPRSISVRLARLI